MQTSFISASETNTVEHLSLNADVSHSFSTDCFWLACSKWKQPFSQKIYFFASQKR